MRGVVLLYHKIGDVGDKSLYNIDLEVFWKQAEVIRNSGIAPKSLAEVAGMLEGNRGAGEGKFIAITFDDAHITQYDAAGFLLPMGIKPCIFAPAGLVGKPSFMDWKMLAQLMGEGCTIGSHGLTHQVLTVMRDEEIRNELESSKKLIEDKLGAPVEFFSPPEGYYTGRVARIARECGYKAVFTSVWGIVDESTNPFLIPRIGVKRHMGLEEFEKAVYGEPFYIFCKRLNYRTRAGLKKILGVALYKKLRGRMLGE